MKTAKHFPFLQSFSFRFRGKRFYDLVNLPTFFCLILFFAIQALPQDRLSRIFSTSGYAYIDNGGSHSEVSSRPSHSDFPEMPALPLKEAVEEVSPEEEESTSQDGSPGHARLIRIQIQTRHLFSCLAQQSQQLTSPIPLFLFFKSWKLDC
jgi:hypothetical protein